MPRGDRVGACVRLHVGAIRSGLRGGLGGFVGYPMRQAIFEWGFPGAVHLVARRVWDSPPKNVEIESPSHKRREQARHALAHALGARGL